jgi:hypothetical protein
MIAMWFV